MHGYLYYVVAKPFHKIVGRKRLWIKMPRKLFRDTNNEDGKITVR